MSTTDQAVLIVDDRPANLLTLERTLEETQARIFKAGSGSEALAATLETTFALAILDVQMPGMDGYELAELLRGNPETRGIPLVFLTAASREEWQVFKGYESGAVDYIVKPFNPEVLLSKVRVFLELDRRSQELEQSRRRLAEVNSELEAFSYSVSHDLRAPLRAIAGFSDILLKDCGERLEPGDRDLLTRIIGETERMSRLITDLLELSRLTRQELQWSKVNLSDLTHQILGRLRQRDPLRKVILRIAEGLWMNGDSRLLTQALENLLENAWKFTKTCPEAVIEVGTSYQRGRECFYVRDNGVGFDMNFADTLFTPFQRLHSSEEYPGTGIGLSTVRRIIRRHGGQVWCESRPGEGTTMWFSPGDKQPTSNPPV